MCFFFLLFMFVLFFVITSACLSEIAENNACFTILNSIQIDVRVLRFI